MEERDEAVLKGKTHKKTFRSHLPIH